MDKYYIAQVEGDKGTKGWIICEEKDIPVKHLKMLDLGKVQIFKIESRAQTIVNNTKCGISRKFE